MMKSLPPSRGPISEAVADALSGEPLGKPFALDDVTVADPFGDDLQLALHLCYELHYTGLSDVDGRWEWDPELLRLRAAMEEVFLAALKAGVVGGEDVEAEFEELLVEPVDAEGVSHFLLAEGEWWQLRELFAHRSIYHLKEADPHAWVIPRLRGRAKAALVAVEFDEFGGGHAESAHAELFADLLRAAGLPDRPLALLDHVPAPMPAIVNMMSLFGLHRRWRGALAGHLAATEITTAPSARRMDEALGKLDAPADCRFFYTEHIEADAVHEQIMRHDVVGDLLEREPELAPDIVFGVQATNLLEGRLSDHLLTSWRAGVSSLRQPLRPQS